MANVNEFSETPRPTANIIRYIGGATIYDAKPLSEVACMHLENYFER